jgi:8-oxo-dGTP pyrophosphatase MutT (NUDIX family)
MGFSLVRVAVIAIKDNKLLLIHRFKDGREFWVIPGGSREKGESLAEAGKREMAEETGLEVEIGEKLWEYENDYYGQGIRKEYYFLAKSVSDGELEMLGEELLRMSEQDKFDPKWVALDKIKDINLVPEVIKEKIVEKFC